MSVWFNVILKNKTKTKLSFNLQHGDVFLLGAPSLSTCLYGKSALTKANMYKGKKGQTAQLLCPPVKRHGKTEGGRAQSPCLSLRLQAKCQSNPSTAPCPSACLFGKAKL